VERRRTPGRAAGLAWNVDGERVGCALPPGIRWVQTLVACLMRGLVFCPVPPGHPSSTEPRALLDETGALSVRPCSREPDERGLVVRFEDGRAWIADHLDAVIASVPVPRVGARILSKAPWSDPSGLAGAVWLALTCGGELHVGLTDEELHRLAPDVISARPGDLRDVLDAVPTTSAGLAVIAGTLTGDDAEAARQRAWTVASLSF
jgi:acyl-CoA synthetase (AMP-forming)/AMP-acid ligase II